MKLIILIISFFSAVAIQAAAPVVSTPSGHYRQGNQTVLASVDSQINTKWCDHHNGRPVQWMAKLPKPQVVKGYSFVSGNDVPTRDPKEWVLEGSQDGKKWTQLDRKNKEPIFEKRRQSRSYEFKNDTAFSYYKFTFKTHDATHFQFSEIGLKGVSFAGVKLDVPPAPPEPPTLE